VNESAAFDVNIFEDILDEDRILDGDCGSEFVSWKSTEPK
jgi:hypothetical protein